MKCKHIKICLDWISPHLLIKSGIFPNEQISYSSTRWHLKIATKGIKLVDRLGRIWKRFRWRLPYRWIKKYLEIYKKCILLSVSMRIYRNKLTLNSDNVVLNTGVIRFLHDILQGDSLSPLLLWLTLMHLSKLFIDVRYDYKGFDKIINSLFYMNDLKLFGKNDQRYKAYEANVKQFSDDIRMRFSLDKHAKSMFIKGTWQTSNVNHDQPYATHDSERTESYR